MYGGTTYITARMNYEPSRDKAGMKTSSFLKIGVIPHSAQTTTFTYNVMYNKYVYFL